MRDVFRDPCKAVGKKIPRFVRVNSIANASFLLSFTVHFRIDPRFFLFYFFVG